MPPGHSDLAENFNRLFSSTTLRVAGYRAPRWSEIVLNATSQSTNFVAQLVRRTRLMARRLRLPANRA